jgi:hypothetical protein
MNKKVPLFVIVLIVVSTVSTVIVSFSLLTSKPTIEYNMSGYGYTLNQPSYNPYIPFYTAAMPDAYTLYNANTPLMVAIHWQNKGNIDASIQLNLKVTNANITWYSNYSTLESSDQGFSTPATGQNYSGEAITFNFEAKANSTIQNRFLNIMPVGNPQNFTVTYTIMDRSNAFTLSPVGEISATYELTNENQYKLEK